MLKDKDYIFLHNEKATHMIEYKDKFTFGSHKGNIRLEGELNYGDDITTNSGDKFYILRPSLIDYMMKVKRKTTIVYPKEAGLIILELGVQSGSKIIEIGTGSSSLTILLSRLAGKEGRIYSFDKNIEHQENAIKNFEKFKEFDNVFFKIQDPSIDMDLGVTDAEAVFIDIPSPWTVLKAAYSSLAGGGHIGTLSPNIEQITTTVNMMENVGFTRIRCFEVLTRGIRVSKRGLTRPFDRMIGHTAYLLFAEKINNPVKREIEYHI